MVSTTKSAETWQTLIELRCQREIVERWLASSTLAPLTEQFLREVLRDVEDQLQALSNVTPR